MRKKHIILLTLSYILLTSHKQDATNVITLLDWKFKIGDSLVWANPEYNDALWNSIASGVQWEAQGYLNYDGYAWYRKSFELPQNISNQSFFKDTFQIYLGQIDDCDEVYLNGFLIGKNGRTISTDDTLPFDKELHMWKKQRVYKLSKNDTRVLWGKKNIISVRVFDRGSGGGMYCGIPTASMRDVKDYILLATNNNEMPLLSDSTFMDFVTLKNSAEFADFSGKLTIKIENLTTKQVISQKEVNIELKAGSTIRYDYILPKLPTSRIQVEISFCEPNSKFTDTKRKQLPYILTPKPKSIPRINGPKVTAASPGKPFLFRIPVSGDRPIIYSAENLPKGLVLDANTGIISGLVDNAAEYNVKLKAKNAKGEAIRDFKIIIGDKLCPTPPMGWNSWNCWGLSVSEEKMKSTVDMFITKGLADHGWAYVNIDDGWESPTRDANGQITTNEKFGDMKKLSDYIHAQGLKLGIYSSPGPKTCGGYLGSFQHELDDIRTYSEWGIDYLKYDWCSYSMACEKCNELIELKKPYIRMEECLKKADRDIVYSLCQYGMGDVWKWGGSIGAQLWRTTGDITDTWESMSAIGFNQESATSYAKPGNWNDPDMLVLGYVGWGPSLHPTRLSPNEQYTHISLWSLLAAPLLLGCDLSRLDDFTLSLLTNDEVIEVNQDILGKQASQIAKGDHYIVFAKDLEDGSKAVGLFNTGNDESVISIDWEKLNISGEQTVRDLWRQTDIGRFDKKTKLKFLRTALHL